MNSKTKFTLMVTAMVAVTLFAIVGIMAVFAATQQTFSTSITVVYKSTNVEGTASAQWKLGRVDDQFPNGGNFFGSNWNDMDSNGEKEDGETMLNLSDNGPLSLTPAQGIELSDEYPAVAFKYVFTNTAEHPYTLNFTYKPNTNTKNVNVFYELASHDLYDNYLGNTTDKFTNMIDTVVPAGQTQYIGIVLITNDLGSDSMFDGTFNIELNGQSSDYNEDYIYLYDGTNATIIGPADPNSTTLDLSNASYKGESITKIQRNAFSYNTNLQNVILNGIREIGVSAFYSCTGITNITFGDELVIIENGAFNGCTGITNLPLGNNLKTIGDSAFFGCEKIESITIPSSVSSIGSEAFGGCTLSNIKVDIGNETFTTQDDSGTECNAVINKNSHTLTVGCKYSIIPSDGSVTAIGDGAFSNCTGLTNITIPECVINIGNNAFSGCRDVTELTIHESVKQIGFFAFGALTNLQSITYNAENVEDLDGRDTFGNSDNVFGYRTGENKKSVIVTIGENVKHIPAFLFRGYYGYAYPYIKTVIINSADVYKELTGKGAKVAGDLLGCVEGNDNQGILKVKTDIVEGNEMPEYLANNYTKSTAEDGYYTFTKIVSD